jgi:DNA invertase Pin-like site-specific DNA recombinase
MFSSFEQVERERELSRTFAFWAKKKKGGEKFNNNRFG